MSEPFPNGVPKPALLAMGLLVLVALVGTAAVRLSGVDVRQPEAEVVASRELRFEDRMDGSIAVISADSGRVLTHVVGENGFVRGTLRGMARERKRHGQGAEQPFVLSAHADGRVILSDPVSGRRVDLASFGTDNPQPFVAMLRLPEPAAQP